MDKLYVGAKSIKRRNFLMVSICLVSLVFLVVQWQSRQREPLEKSSRAIMLAVLNGDGNSLSPFVFQAELDENQLTTSEVSEIISQVVVPNLRLAGFDENTDVSCQELSAQGMCYAFVSHENSVPLELPIGTFYSDGRPKFFLGELIISSWVLRYQKENNVPSGRTAIQQGIRVGKERDSAVLKSLGYRKLTRGNVTSGQISYSPL